MIRLQNISKFYNIGDTRIQALCGISIDLHAGELTVILGPSGSGKSTMLNILGGIDTPSTGELIVNGIVQKQEMLSKYRKNIVGFVFQFYNLISNLSVWENVAIAERLVSKRTSQADLLIEKVGLSERKNNFPDQLSGGEMQRVAIARALSKKPTLLLCDEPTGALDSSTSKNIFQLLKNASNENTAVIIVTHNEKVAQIADRVVYLKDGKIQRTQINKKPSKISEVDWE